MPKAEAKKSKRIFIFLRIAVVLCGIVGGIFWVSREQRWNRLAEIFRQMNIAVFVAVLGVFIISQIIIGLRWWLLLRSQHISIHIWAVVRLYLLGWFYNNFMPGSVGGDLLRAWYVTRHTPKKFEAVLSVFVDRVIGLLSTLVIAVFFYLLFLRGRGPVLTASDRPGFLESAAEYKGILFCIIAAVVVIFCILLILKKSRSILINLFLSVRASAVKIMVKLKDAIVIYCRNIGTIFVAFGLTFFLQLLTITGFWLLGRNLGIEAGVVYYYVFFTLTWVLGTIPVSIGGAVVVEVLLASLFIKFAGVDAESASALALCQRAVWMLASLPGAAIHLIGAHLPGAPKNDETTHLEAQKDFFIDS